MSALALLENALQDYHVAQQPRAKRLDQPYEASPSLLYFVTLDSPDRFVKIGITSNIATRISNAQANCPYPLKLLKVVTGAWHLERSLHKRFSNLHVSGEWFRLEGELEELINRLP